MTNNQAKILNTKDAMHIIIEEAKKVVAEKFETTVEIVNIAIQTKNKNVMNMMRKLVKKGVNEAATLCMSDLNPRYKIFKDQFGDQPMWVYVNFISIMRKIYTGDDFHHISDHNDFTKFIEHNAHKVHLDMLS